MSMNKLSRVTRQRKNKKYSSEISLKFPNFDRLHEKFSMEILGMSVCHKNNIIQNFKCEFIIIMIILNSQ